MGKWLGAVWCLFLSAQLAFGFSYGALRRIIRENKVTSIDELLPLLPEHYRKNYTLVYQSRSLQAGAVWPEWPRVILYGDDAKLILAFTKNPSTPPQSTLADALETIEFDDAKAEFRFRSIPFVAGKDPFATEPEVNPAVCKKCHGQDPRPNWDSYNLWPGVYGSVSRSDCDTMQEGTPELKYYQTFMSTNRNRDRYQYLPRETSDFGKCPQPPHRDFTFRNAVMTHPNAKLTDLLFNLNARRIKRLIVASPTYETYKYLWAGFAQECLSDVEKFFPPNYAAENQLADLSTTKQELKIFAQEQFQELVKSFLKHNVGSQYDTYRAPANFLDDSIAGQFTQLEPTALFKLIAERSNVSTTRWETGFSNGKWAYTTPTRGISEMLRRWSLPGVGSKTCDELAAKSIEQIELF